MEPETLADENFQGLNNIRVSGARILKNCRFSNGSVVNIIPTDSLDSIFFVECVFESGSQIHFRPNLKSIDIVKCHLPPLEQVFIGGASVLTFNGLHPCYDFANFMPEYKFIFVGDGVGGRFQQGVRWEITKKFAFRKGTTMMYRNMIPFRDPGSLAILESMLWENCRFYVVCITWRGSRDHPAYLAYHNAYKYPYRINTLTILPLLWMRILPVELIRGIFEYL